MVSKTEFNKMQNGSFIINTARGGIVNELELLSAVDQGQLAAAGFDVLEVEPPQNPDFIHHPKTFVTTHIGGSSEEAILAMGFAAIDGLSDYTIATNFKKYK